MNRAGLLSLIGMLLPTVGFSQVSAPATAVSRRIDCQLVRQPDGSAVGPCLASLDTVARITFRAPATPLEGAILWRGTASLRWRGGQIEPVALEPRAGAAFRTGTQWFEVLASVVTPSRLHFAVDQDRPAPPTEADLRILRLARTYVGDSAAWKPGVDDQPAMRDPNLGFNCPLVGALRGERKAGARTLFCALHDASVAVDGEYWHGRPAVNAVRAAIGAAIATAGVPRPQHPLTDFNSAPTTRLSDVQRIFDRAAEMIEAQLGGRR